MLWFRQCLTRVRGVKMTAMKKSAVSVREEMRLLGEVVEAPSVLDKWLTSEFWTMAVTAVTNLIAVAVMIGWVDGTSVEVLTKALTALLGATEVIVVNSVLVWKYLSGRETLRAKMLDARLKYMELALKDAK